MGEIVCEGKICYDKETGRTFFIPSKKCNPEAYAKVREEATSEGISFAKLIKQEKAETKKK